MANVFVLQVLDMDGRSHPQAVFYDKVVANFIASEYNAYLSKHPDYNGDEFDIDECDIESKIKEWEDDLPEGCSSDYLDFYIVNEVRLYYDGDEEIFESEDLHGCLDCFSFSEQGEVCSICGSNKMIPLAVTLAITADVLEVDLQDELESLVPRGELH